MNQNSLTSGSTCRNCDAPLTGIYCAQCGQKNDSSRPTFGHFVGEGLESLTHADSRLWRSLWLLISRPGFLTVEFFAGRRSQYLPPIRLYFVLSVVFFLGLTLSPGDISVETKGETVNINADCNQLVYDGPFGQYMQPKLRNACLRLKQGDSSDALANSLLTNAPKAMWVLLPLFAMFMMLFWWSPRRLYAEHFLFLIHNHSAVFALLSADMLVTAVLPESITDWISLVVPIYLLWYTLRGMRVFYADSRTLTFFKFTALLLLYSFCVVLVLSLTGLAAVFSL